MIAVGATIGSGIFLTPQSIAEALPNEYWILVIWAVGGIVALTGALTYSELNSGFPEAGGIYVYLREGYGPLAGFLYGWATLMIVNTGSIAALCLGFMYYADYIIREYSDYAITDSGKQILSIAALIGLTILNLRSAKTGGTFASLFTVLKIAGILALIGLGMGWGVVEEFSMSTEMKAEPAGGFWTAAALAMVGVLWSYGGWQHTTYLAAEARGGPSSVSRAMVYGAILITAVYILTNIAYFYMLPLDTIANSDQVAADAVQTILGPAGGTAIAIVIFISMFGTTGIYTMTAPRIYYAMAKDKVFFQQLGKVSERTGVPTVAVVVQTIWTIVLILFWGTFKDLVDYVVFTDFLFMLIAAIAIFWFRKQGKTGKQGYRTPLYPLTPIVFIGILTWFTASMLIGQSEPVIAGLILLGVGTIVFYAWKKF